MTEGPSEPAPEPPATPPETDRRITVAIVVAVMALLVGAAGLLFALLDDDDDEVAIPDDTFEPIVSPEPTEFLPEETVDAIPAGWTNCTNSTELYSVAYPEDWVTISDDPSFECQFFDRDAFEIEEDSEFPLTDLVVEQTDIPFQTAVDGFSENARLVSSESIEIERRAAVVLETEATGEGLYPEGTRTYAYVIDRTGNAFVVRTTVPPDADDFTANTKIVDQAVDTVRFL